MKDKELKGEGARVVANAILKEKTKQNQGKRKIEEDTRIVEYVKYLIDEQENTNFKLCRSDFAQAFELHSKSLVQPFDDYAQKEDNAMKLVANDLLERVEYNAVCQDKYKPIAEELYKDEPKYAYLIQCAKELQLAIPVLARIVNKSLTLSNY